VDPFNCPNVRENPPILTGLHIEEGYIWIAKVLSGRFAEGLTEASICIFIFTSWWSDLRRLRY
jgi:hypothetical protein